MNRPTISGFNYIGKCNCSGTTNYKYESGPYMIYYLPKRRSFHIKHNNSYTHKNEPAIKLCEILKSLGFTDCEVSLNIN